jgi:hypothetical protein
MPPLDRTTKPARVGGRERSVEIQLGGLGGIELRPTRCFVWGGPEREGRERVLPIGGAPRNLVVPRRERELSAGTVRVRSLGNPLWTVTLAGAHVLGALRRAGR